jgi:aryl-alcohol dehydrogenase-like predicted oxidoreductase
VSLLPGTDLDVHRLCLGGDVFGWTADEEQSFAVLDRYAEAGGNFIDTADMYSCWVPGNSGGESEAIVGRWMAERGNRDEMVIATKVGKLEGLRGLGGLAADTIARAAEDSLRRLGTDRIDLLYPHEDDPETPLEETLGAFDRLVRDGKVRHMGASNFTAERLSAALAVSDREGLIRYAALQPEYSLMERGYEHGLQDLCREQGLGCVPYSALAGGFLTGKYRPGEPAPHSPRGPKGASYLDDPRAPEVLGALHDIASAHETTVPAVALAWLAAQDTVASPISSARTLDQLEALLPMAELELSEQELERLSAAGHRPGT